MGVSNKITAVLNLIAFLASISVVGAATWLASKPDNQCIRSFRWPIVILGILLLLISLAGFVGAYCNKKPLLAIYLCSMAILIIVLLIVLVFAFVVTRPDGSYVVPGTGFKEYRLPGFSAWLRNHVTDSDNWGKIRTCLVHSHLCQNYYRSYISSQSHQVLSAPHLSPLQSGCCKPPTLCGYSNVINPIMSWMKPTTPLADPDCSVWNNDQNQLCYNCDACKAGLLGNLRQEWMKANVVLIVALVVLIFVYLIGCSAYKNAQTEDLFRRYKQGWV